MTFRSGDLNPRFSVIFPPMIWTFMESEEDEIKSKKASKKDRTLSKFTDPNLLFPKHEIERNCPAPGTSCEYQICRLWKICFWYLHFYRAMRYLFGYKSVIFDNSALFHISMTFGHQKTLQICKKDERIERYCVLWCRAGDQTVSK